MNFLKRPYCKSLNVSCTYAYALLWQFNRTKTYYANKLANVHAVCNYKVDKIFLINLGHTS